MTGLILGYLSTGRDGCPPWVEAALAKAPSGDGITDGLCSELRTQGCRQPCGTAWRWPRRGDQMSTGDWHKCVTSN
jgi:hypothetical protein